MFDPFFKKQKEATPEMVEEALILSEKGKKSLAALSAYARSALLRKMATLLREHKEEVAALITQEMGKTIRESRAEVDYAAGYFD